MSVTSCTLIYTGQVGGADWELNRRYTSVYRVICSDPKDGAVTVMLAPDLPSLYSRYQAGNDYDLGSLAKSYAPRRVNGNIWEVTVDYESWAQIERGLEGKNPELQKELADITALSNPDASTTNDPQNPLDRPALVRGGKRAMRRPIYRDKNGKAPVNSCFEKLDPPIEADDNRPFLTITKWVDTISLVQIRQYQDAVNSDVFLGCPPYVAKVQIEFSRQFTKTQTGSYLYWEVTYDFEFRKDLWIPYLVLDCGFTTLAKNASLPGKRILDPSTGMPVSQPVALYTVTGGENPPLAASPGDVIVLPAGYDPQFVEFTLYDALPFSVFGIDAITGATLT